MKKILFYSLVFCLSSCTNNSQTEKQSEKETDSVNYIITDNFKFWLSTLKPNGDTGNIYLREVIFENKTSRSIYLPIADTKGFTEPLFSANHSFDNKIISPCITQQFRFDKDSGQSGQWTMNSDCDLFDSRREVKSHAKESFYIRDSGPNEISPRADSFVFKIDYWFDTLMEKHSIVKNLYSSNKKLIEVEKFKSLEK